MIAGLTLALSAASVAGTAIVIIQNATLQEGQRTMSDTMTALTNAFAEYKAKVDAKLAGIPAETAAAVASAVTAATADDAAAGAALLTTIKDASAALDAPAPVTP